MDHLLIGIQACLLLLIDDTSVLPCQQLYYSNHVIRLQIAFFIQPCVKWIMASIEGKVCWLVGKYWSHNTLDWNLVAGVEVNIELEERTDPSETNTESQARSNTATAATVSPQLHGENDQLKPDLFRSYSSVEGSQRRTMSYVKQVPCDDDISFLEDVDICLVIPSKLRHLDYPRVEDSHDEDVAKVIRKKFSKLGIDETSKDILAFLSSDHQHSSYVSWQVRIEEAAEEEDNDAFWENVSGQLKHMLPSASSLQKNG